MKSFLAAAVASAAFMLSALDRSALADTVPAPDRSADLDPPVQTGTSAHAIDFESGTPPNYEAIIGRRPFPSIRLDAELFLPDVNAPFPVVIIAPGSGGVSAPVREHAKALVANGIAVLLIDPFGRRGVRSTVTDQLQFSFAASSFDVLAAARHLAARPEIDAERIGALGYSRGGIAVLQAAVSVMARSVLGEHRVLRAVAAGWPWCGYQFKEPRTAPTAVRLLVADQDDWVSPIQCQAYASAMQQHNPDVSIRLFQDALHGFGYGRELTEIPGAQKALTAPIVYLNDEGTFLDWYTGEPLPGADDGELARRYEPFITRGARAGSKGDQAHQFVEDVVEFFTQALRR
jgi:dienelactone hydrolase